MKQILSCVETEDIHLLAANAGYLEFIKCSLQSKGMKFKIAFFYPK